MPALRTEPARELMLAVARGETVVLRQARGRTALSLGLFIAMAGIGGVLASDPDARIIGWLCIVVFGLFALLVTVQLARPARLTLAAEGLRADLVGGSRNWRWDRVSGFRLWRDRVTLITFVDADAKPGMIQRINARIGAGSASLPADWTLAPQATCDLLEAARVRWG